MEKIICPDCETELTCTMGEDLGDEGYAEFECDLCDLMMTIFTEKGKEKSRSITHGKVTELKEFIKFCLYECPSLDDIVAGQMGNSIIEFLKDNSRNM
jgi:hypothetical protein